MTQIARGQSLLIGASLAIGVAVVAGLFVMGSPAEERLRRLDTQRADDLRDIAYAMDTYYTRNQRLPPALDSLPLVAGMPGSVRDPVTNQSYEYRVVDSMRFELCATFDRASDDSRFIRASFWMHGPGRHCFDLTARAIGR